MITKNFIQPKEFSKNYPNCYTEYMKLNGDSHKSLNHALDSLLFHFGIGVVLLQVYSKFEKFLGYRSFIKFYPGNKVMEESREICYIEDYKKFKIAEKANKITTLRALDILESKLSLRHNG